MQKFLPLYSKTCTEEVMKLNFQNGPSHGNELHWP